MASQGIWALGGLPVSLVAGQRMLLEKVLFFLFTLQQDVVATSPCGECVLEDSRMGYTLIAAFILNNPFMFFRTQDCLFGELSFWPVKFFYTGEKKRLEKTNLLEKFPISTRIVAKGTSNLCAHKYTKAIIGKHTCIWVLFNMHVKVHINQEVLLFAD